MKFTFNSHQYGTTVEINFEATHIDQIREMFDQFLRGSGFYIVEDEEEPDMAYRPNGLTVEDDDIQEYKKPWVGLSDVEVETYSNMFNGIRLVKAIEALLKERNNG